MNRNARLILALGITAMWIALPTAAQARTKTVVAGPPGLKLAKQLLGKKFIRKYNPDINDFFLHRVTINQGDTIRFIINGFHDIDLPGTSGHDLPLIVPGATVNGVKDSAGNSFWFNGLVPSLGLNPALLAPIGGHKYNGSSRVDSGLPLGPPKPFKVKFTKPGTYKYFCDIHPGMVGFVVVLPKGKQVPTAAQDAATLTSQALRDIKIIKKLAKKKIQGANVHLGQPGRHGVELYQMFPRTLSVSAGTMVTFAMPKGGRDIHTATFGPTPYVMSLANSLTGLAPAQQAWYPSDPGTISFSPTSHGNGYVNTGILDRDPATLPPSSYQIKFTTPGTYQFICLIHPFMRGTIVVK